MHAVLDEGPGSIGGAADLDENKRRTYTGWLTRRQPESSHATIPTRFGSFAGKSRPDPQPIPPGGQPPAWATGDFSQFEPHADRFLSGPTWAEQATAASGADRSYMAGARPIQTFRPFDPTAYNAAIAGRAMIDAARGGPLGALAGVASMNLSPSARLAVIGAGAAADSALKAAGGAGLGLGRAGPLRRGAAAGPDRGAAMEPGPYDRPPNDGFMIKNTTTLPPGSRVGRYGDDDGYYVAPAGTPRDQLSLQPGTTKDYSVFEVARPMPGVTSGSIMPWYGQEGGGLQYKTPMDIEQALKQGYFKRWNNEGR